MTQPWAPVHGTRWLAVETASQLEGAAHAVDPGASCEPRKPGSEVTCGLIPST